MSSQNPVQVVFLSEPRIGERVQMILEGKQIASSVIIDLRSDPQYPGWIWIKTQSGSVYVGQLSSSAPTTMGWTPATPSKKRRSKIALYIICGFFGLVILGSMLPNQDQTAKPMPSAQTAPDKVLIEISAEQLLSAYEANGVAADNAYKDKSLSVTGTISSIGKDITDTPYICLGENSKTVQCMFPNSSQALANLQKGQVVTIVGMCQGDEIIGVLLGDCSLR